MNILIQNSSDTPIYQQIYEQIQDAILSGELTEGYLLPSIRQLSRELKVSVITTTRAYTDLENEGYIMIVQGKGCYVKGLRPDVIEDRLMASMEDHFQAIKKSAHMLNKTKEELWQILQTLMEEYNDE